MPKILIVDDEQEIAMMLEKQFSAHGFEVIQAHDGQEGLQAAKTHAPDIIILDEMMPKMDGYKVCGLLKNDTRFNRIPVIMFTARAEEQDPDMAREAGINLYLTKLVDFSQLLEHVNRLIKEMK